MLFAQFVNVQTPESSRKNVCLFWYATLAAQNRPLNSYERTKLEVYLNIKKMGQNVLLAVCDCDLLGRTLREGKIVFHVKDEFYNGRKATVDEAVGLINNSTIVNLVGKNCVGKAIAKGYVHPEAVIKIEGIPHAQIVKF
jgi:uncharacterized protein